jgi:hypothetical protein
MKEFFIGMLAQRGPNYNQLITNVALHLLESDDGWDSHKKIESGVFIFWF